MSRSALGKGLNALIRPVEPPSTEIAATASRQDSGATEIDVDRIDTNPYQPRRQFRQEALEELAQSIRSAGVIQPLVLRKSGERYQLIAGERRWRAAQLAGLKRVPAVVRDIAEEEVLEITLVENVQREDLSPVELARAFERLADEFSLTQEEIASRTGKDRATIANTLRLLKLEKSILDLIDGGRLSPGHGRALLAIDDGRLRTALAERAARGRLTVRQIEHLANRKRTKSVASPTTPDPNVRAAIEDLQRALGTRVVLRQRRGSRPGLLGIEYYDEQQLIALYDRLLGR
ncbi:MAG TPA: ParB/RepB/Spo0J family partition protein [Patescibacteria group bacterium]|nr:ParB/RepB/Spo0J family partition protein [Patescibacteria group bacterium]